LIFNVDLEHRKEPYRSLPVLQETTADECARHVHIAVGGFAQTRAALLQRIVEEMSPFYEMVLFDHDCESNRLVVLCEFPDSLAGFRTIVFKGDIIERLWKHS
jgi:hypothetical protein